MAASEEILSEESDVVPIFLLPDELLMDIFSYITYIPEKMDLERVSKRIRYVSSQSPSWQGIHKIEMMMKCWNRSYDDLAESCREKLGVYSEMKGNCSDEHISLNGIGVPFVKWPAAIQLLLDRTNINQLIIHCWEDSHPEIFHILDLFEHNGNKMKLKSLELHLCSYAVDSDDNSIVTKLLKNILTNSLQMAIPYLQELVLQVYMPNIQAVPHVQGNFNDSLSKMWPILQQCNSLKSFTFCHECGEYDASVIPLDLSVLIGKPLKKITISKTMDQNDNELMNDLSKVMNGATGEGVQSLSLVVYIYGGGKQLEPWMALPFQDLCQGLNEDSRAKLKSFDVSWLDTDHLRFIPYLFQNLEKIQTIDMYIGGDTGESAIDMFVSFLTNAHAESSKCKMKIYSPWLDSSVTKFKRNLLIACQNADIDVQFGESPTEVLLSKGNAAIIIDEVHSNDKEDSE